LAATGARLAEFPFVGEEAEIAGRALKSDPETVGDTARGFAGRINNFSGFKEVIQGHD